MLRVFGDKGKETRDKFFNPENPDSENSWLVYLVSCSLQFPSTLSLFAGTPDKNAKRNRNIRRKMILLQLHYFSNK
jgi:hypothetical protein